MLETLSEIFSNPLESLVNLLNTPAFALWGPFFGLLACGMGLPIPEDIILVTAGFLAGQNAWPILPPIIVTYCGILIGDSFIFLVGQKMGFKVLDSKFGQRVLSPKRLDKARNAFHKYGIWVNFFARFLPGVRTAVFFTGGTLKYPFYRFLFMDGLAALISAPLFVWLGYWAGQHLSQNFDELNAYIKTTKTYFGIGLVLLLAGVFVYFYLRKRSKKAWEKANETETPL